MLKIFISLFTFLSFSLNIVSADVVGTIASTDKVFGNVLIYLFNPLLQFATVIAFLYFLYGVFKYILAMSSGGTNDEINNGKRNLLWGMIGLFIIFSINGILMLINTALGSFFK